MSLRDWSKLISEFQIKVRERDMRLASLSHGVAIRTIDNNPVPEHLLDDQGYPTDECLEWVSYWWAHQMTAKDFLDRLENVWAYNDWDLFGGVHIAVK